MPADPAHVVLHLPGSVLREPERMRGYYQRLINGLQDRGIQVDLIAHHRDIVAAQVAEDPHFHIIDHGSYTHPRVLNTGIAYLYPYWNLDPLGIRAESSIGTQRFHAAYVDAAASAAFYTKLRKRLVGQRRSRAMQPTEKMTLPAHCIAVFLQSEGHPAVVSTAHFPRADMVAALLGRDDPRPIVLKIRPDNLTDDTRRWLESVKASDPRVHVTAANIHDILAAADVSVTINSAVGVESLLHSTPVVLCGRADFHHCAITAHRPDTLDAALAETQRRHWPYRKFLYWYFALNCLSAASPTLAEDVLTRIAATGFPLERFGLTPPEPTALPTASA